MHEVRRYQYPSLCNFYYYLSQCKYLVVVRSTMSNARLSSLQLTVDPLSMILPIKTLQNNAWNNVFLRQLLQLPRLSFSESYKPRNGPLYPIGWYAFTVSITQTHIAKNQRTDLFCLVSLVQTGLIERSENRRVRKLVYVCVHVMNASTRLRGSNSRSVGGVHQATSGDRGAAGENKGCGT